MKTIIQDFEIAKEHLEKCLAANKNSKLESRKTILTNLKENLRSIESDNGEQAKYLYRSLQEKASNLVVDLNILPENSEMDKIFKERETLLQKAIDSGEIDKDYRQLLKSIEKIIRRFQIALEDDPEQIRQSCWWFIAKGEEDDLIELVQIEAEVNIDSDRLPVYANNPDLIELLVQAKESIVVRIVKEKAPDLYNLASELFTDDTAIGRWFISGKKFLNGKTPLSCLKDPEGIKLIERQIGQSLAGVSA